MTKFNSTYFNHTETGLSQGAHNVTYSCNDTVGNMNASSGITNFTIDSVGPTISDANTNEINITLNAYFCLNITSTDSSGISSVLAEVWNTTNFVNYSMTDTGTPCGGIGEDHVYGANIQGTAVGEWNYSKAHSNDSLNNWNTNDFTDISINVTAPINNPPTNPSPELISVDGTNYTSSDLNCSSTLTDLDSGDTLNVTVIWYKDDIVNLTINYNENYDNGTLFSTVLDSENTSANDEWKCGLRLYDGISYSNWVNSSSITILEFPYPQFSNIVTSPDNNTEYAPNTAYQFNATISDTNGTAGIEFDGENYTASNESSVFSAAISNLGAGTYSYYWWAYNGDYSNTTTIKYYTISKNVSTTTLDINETSPIVYGTYINVTCETTNKEETKKLYRDGNDISSEIAESILLGVGTYNYVCNITETQNYTSSSDSDSFTVNKAAGNISLLLNGTASNQTDIYGVQTNASASTLYGTLTLYRNSIDVTPANNDYITLGVGNWNWTATSSGNQNYSSATITRWSHITQASSSVNLYLNHSQDNITIEENTKIWLNATIQTGEGAIELYNNGTLINSGSSPLANFTNFTSPGIYNITTTHPSTQNYSGSSTTLWVNVTAFVDTTFPLVTITSPEEINYSISVIEFNVSLNEAGFCQYSLDSGITNITMTSNSSDTGFNATNSSMADGQYTSNFYCNDTTGNLNSTESISFGIDSTAPTVNLISPTNNTLNDTTNTIDFYYNVTDTNSIANCSLTINYAINKTSDNPAKETTNNITTYLPNGDYLWGINCTDQIGNTGTSETFNISINYTDSTPPSVTQNSPAEDYTGTTSDPMPVTFDCSATDNNALKNISLYITNNQNDSFSLNQTTDLSGTSDSATWQLNLANGNYTWNCLAYDEYNNQDWGDNRSILINYVPSVTPISGGGGTRRECRTYSECRDGHTCVDHKCVKFFDAKITDLKLPIQAGEFLNFTYFIKGVAIIEGDVIVEFRLEKDSEIITSGSDTIFIGRMEEKTEEASLFLPTTMEGGTYDFYVRVNYEDYKAEAHRKIEIEQALLSKLSILLIKMPSPKTSKELEFSFSLKPLKDLPMPIKLKEEIKKDGKVIWFKEMDLIIEKETSLTEKADKLKAGDYLLEITSYYKGQTSRFAQSFTVKEARAFNIYPILIILLAIISFLYFRRKLKLKRLKKAIKNELGKVIKSVKKIKITEDRISEPPKKKKVVIEEPEEEPRGATIAKKRLKGIVINIGDFDTLGTKLKEGLRKGYIEKGANKIVKTLRDVRERFRHRLEKANIKKRANKISRRFRYMKAGRRST
jgi:hypothetical protein